MVGINDLIPLIQSKHRAKARMEIRKFGRDLASMAGEMHRIIDTPLEAENPARTEAMSPGKIIIKLREIIDSRFKELRALCLLAHNKHKAANLVVDARHDLMSILSGIDDRFSVFSRGEDSRKRVSSSLILFILQLKDHASSIINPNQHSVLNPSRYPNLIIANSAIGRLPRVNPVHFDCIWNNLVSNAQRALREAGRSEEDYQAELRANGGGRFSLVVSNYADLSDEEFQRIQDFKDSSASSKTDDGNPHGLGRRIVQDACIRLGGSLEVSYDKETKTITFTAKFKPH